MLCVWFRSSWNYTLRPEPTLSELELSIDPSKTGLCVGSQALGTDLCRMSAGTGLFLAGNQGPFIFLDMGGHVFLFHSARGSPNAS